MVEKKMRFTIGQVARLCNKSRPTITRHHIARKIRNGKPNALGYIEFPRSQVQLYMWQVHGLTLEEVE